MSRSSGRPDEGRVLVAQNRRARHDYQLEQTYQAGLVLTGTEVKALRTGRAAIGDGYAHVRDGEGWLLNVHIPEYEGGTWTNHEPRRARKLLLHKRELRDIERSLAGGGLTLVPLALYFQDGYAKVDLALGRGKRAYDKRQALAKKDAQREAERALRARHRGR